MIFTSFVFLFWFLPLFLGAYYATPRAGRNLALTLASYVFYGWWRPDLLWLIWLSTAVDYGCGRALGELRPGEAPSARGRRWWLLLSLTTNFGLLGFFKYANLLVDTWNDLVGGALALHDWERVVLPVGISFYTFQTLSYTVDVYRGTVRPLRNVIDFACYVAMFPQLVAGPIVRYAQIERELAARRETWAGFSAGVSRFLAGFAKKVLIADNAALLADPLFASSHPGAVAAWVGVSAYAVQIYFDFSGYSDMAVGLGRMLGFRFPENFLSPYRADSITEFWRRWHVSLSSWLRDYLYVPLGGNRRGPARTYFNLCVAMLLGGLWHGAAWTFLCWGAYQGLWLVIERRGGKRPPWHRLPRPLRVAATFAVVLGGWVVFRADNLAGALDVWAGMVGLHGFGTAIGPQLHATLAWAAIAAGGALAFLAPRSQLAQERAPFAFSLMAAASFAVALGQLLSRNYTPFLYFQF